MLAAYLIGLVVGGVFVGLSIFGGLGKDAEADHGEPGHVHEHADAGSVTEAAHVGRPRRPWLPFVSLRFWTFGAFFFGLTGLALNELAGLGEPMAAGLALAAGVGGGTAAAALVHALKKPVGAVRQTSHWVGMAAELLLPLAPRGLSKIRVPAGEKDRELIVTLADPAGGALPKGTRVVVLEIDGEGRARVAPELAVFGERQEVDS